MEYFGKVAKCKAGKIGVIYNKVKHHLDNSEFYYYYVGVSLDGSKWQSKDPEIIADSIIAYIDDAFKGMKMGGKMQDDTEVDYPEFLVISARMLDCEIYQIPQFVSAKLYALDALIKKGRPGSSLVSAQCIADIVKDYMILHCDGDVSEAHYENRTKE